MNKREIKSKKGIKIVKDRSALDKNQPNWCWVGAEGEREQINKQGDIPALEYPLYHLAGFSKGYASPLLINCFRSASGSGNKYKN